MGIAAADCVPHGDVLVALVEAAHAGDSKRLGLARRAVRDALGPAALIDAAAAIASFNAVVKLADGTGIPLESAKAERTAAMRAELAIDAFLR
jgi:hypothetical protein